MLDFASQSSFLLVLSRAVLILGDENGYDDEDEKKAVEH